MTPTWSAVLLVLAALGGGLYAWWDTSLATIRVACLLRRTRLQVIDEMRRDGFVEWAEFAAQHWKDPR